MVKKHKRGSSFIANCEYKNGETLLPIPLTGITISSQIRTSNGVSISSLDLEIVNANAGEYKLSKIDTTAWPLGRAIWDIKYQFGTIKIATETIYLEIVTEATQ